MIPPYRRIPPLHHRLYRPIGNVLMLVSAGLLWGLVIDQMLRTL